MAVYKNEVKIWPANQEWVELEKGTKVDFGTLEISCKQGDTLHFRVNCGSGQNAVDDNVTWNPIVKYTSFVYEKETDPESNNIPPKTSAMAEIPVAGSIAAAGFWSYGYAIGETYTSYDEVNALYWTKAGNLYNRYGYFSFAWNTVTPGWEADNAFTYTMPKDGTIAILGNEETIAFHPDKFGSLDVNISV